jgi:arylsulfatase A-like enzyme
MPQRPNVLFIFADQLRYSALACNGNRIVRTPHIDRLAAEGVAFDQAFSSCPICSPYRGTVFTGRYPHANGVICNEYDMFPGQRTVARCMGEAGWHTAFVGKLHLGYGPYLPGRRFGFDDMIAYNCTHAYYRVAYHHNEHGPFPIREYAPRGETQLALDWIRRHEDERGDQPFCLFLGWGPPHWSHHEGGPRDYGDYPAEYDVYDPRSVDVPANVPGPLREHAAREIADYYAMVTSLDDCMGRLLGTLDEWGLAENTIVCFSSDHGDHLNAHGYGKPGYVWLPPYMRPSKATPFDESIRIPFLVRFPGRVPGHRRTETLLNSVDVMPTLLSLCGLPIPRTVQGRDLSHAALGRPGEEPDSVFLQILGPGWPNRTDFAGLWRGLRTHRHTYARWFGPGGRRVLFDRQADPLEMRSLADDPAHAESTEQMERRLQRWLDETGDPFDTGPRLPQTNMLDLGQRLTSDWAYSVLPPQYAAAIEKYRTKP